MSAALARYSNAESWLGHAGAAAPILDDSRELFVADLPPIEPRQRFAAPRFQRVFCSQCGRVFPPRDNGFSSCRSHAHLTPFAEFDRRAW